MSRSIEQLLECQDVVSASEQRPALPLLRQGFVAVPNDVLVAAAAGVTYGHDFSTEVSHRAILRHAVLVCVGRCLERAWVGGVRVKTTCAEGSERVKDGGDNTRKICSTTLTDLFFSRRRFYREE